MMSNKKISFYAPIKPPDHPIASGDRLIARNLLTALTMAGFETELASRFIAYSKREADSILIERKQAALKEADEIINRLSSSPPKLWLTYHPYCKAPDWIGPQVSKAFNIPYVTIEAARTGQGFENGQDRWARWRAEAQSGIQQADLHLVFKPTDYAYLVELLGSEDKLKNLPPFIDTTAPSKLPTFTPPSSWKPDTPILISVGMMRPGKKLANFELLAKALAPLQHLKWNLLVIGGGPAENIVQSYFNQFDEDRLLFTGSIDHQEVLATMAGSDIFTWPGLKEPIGMVYLEAQLMGLPVVALNSMGVSLTVRHGKTGLLSDEKDISEYSKNLKMLLTNLDLRNSLASAAKANVETNHSLKAASLQLKMALEPMMLSS